MYTKTKTLFNLIIFSFILLLGACELADSGSEEENLNVVDTIENTLEKSTALPINRIVITGETNSGGGSSRLQWYRCSGDPVTLTAVSNKLSKNLFAEATHAFSLSSYLREGDCFVLAGNEGSSMLSKTITFYYGNTVVGSSYIYKYGIQNNGTGQIVYSGENDNNDGYMLFQYKGANNISRVHRTGAIVLPESEEPEPIKSVRVRWDSSQYMVTPYIKPYKIMVTNTGNVSLTNCKLYLTKPNYISNLAIYTASPLSISGTIAPGETVDTTWTIRYSNFSNETGSGSFSYKFYSNSKLIKSGYLNVHFGPDTQ